MDKFKVLDLFSGIGGFSLGLERTGGFKTAAFCEIEEFPRKVLNKHWPGVPIYEDIRELTAERLLSDGIRPDVITGGFPCQDISVAGKQGGITADRSGLWTELARLISEIRPQYAIVENVTALLSGERGRWFQRVLGDLAEIGYDCEWHCIPACELDAPHQRDRLWIVAYSNSQRRNRGAAEQRQNRWQILTRDCFISDHDTAVCTGKHANSMEPVARSDGRNYSTGGGRWPAEPDVGRVANGIPSRVHRLKGLGNAIVPQIAELIGRAILEAEHGGMCENM